MVACPNCGAPIWSNYRACPNCGVDLQQSGSPLVLVYVLWGLVALMFALVKMQMSMIGNFALLGAVILAVAMVCRRHHTERVNGGVFLAILALLLLQVACHGRRRSVHTSTGGGPQFYAPGQK